MEFAKKHKKALLFAIAYAALLLLLMLIINGEALTLQLTKMLLPLRALIIGLVLAYLCNPFFRFYERRLFSKISPLPLRRGISLFATYASVVAIIVVVVLLIVPQLIASIGDFLSNIDGYLLSTTQNINALFERLNQLLPAADGALRIPPISTEDIRSTLDALLLSVMGEGFDLLNMFSMEELGNLLSMTWGLVSGLTDTVIGFFISLYLLATKERCYAQIMRARRALLNEEWNAKITRLCTITDRSFGGFFKGKIIDSVIVGVLTYCLISLFNIPYAILIATVIAITDIVPVIGPFIGVVPSAIIILLTDPARLIPFLLSILLIQQIDGNIIAPKILGENTGVSSLCVLIAITVVGSIWGVAGMILGVPLFATILSLTSSYLDARLKKKGLPIETQYYASSTLSDVPKDLPTNTPPSRTERTTRFSRLQGKERKAEDGTLSDLEQEQLKLETYFLAKQHPTFWDLPNASIASAAVSEDVKEDTVAKTDAAADVPTTPHS